MDWHKLDIEVPPGYSEYALSCYNKDGRYGNEEGLLAPFRNLPIDIITYKFRVLDDDVDNVLIHRDTNNGQFDFDEEVVGAIQVPIENPEIAETLFWDTTEHIQDGWFYYKNTSEIPSTFTVTSGFVMDEKCALIRVENWHSVTRTSKGRRLILSLIIDPKYSWAEIIDKLDEYIEVRT